MFRMTQKTLTPNNTLYGEDELTEDGAPIMKATKMFIRQV